MIIDLFETAEHRREEIISGLMGRHPSRKPVGDWIRRSACACVMDKPDKRKLLNKLVNRKRCRRKPPLSNNQHSRYCLYIRDISIQKLFLYELCLFHVLLVLLYIYIYIKPFIKSDRFGYFFWHDSSLTSLLVDQQIIFGPDSRSTGTVTTWAVEMISRELGVTCNTGHYRITTEIVKDGGRVGVRLRHYITGEVSKSRCYINRCRDKDHVTLMVLWPGSCYRVIKSLYIKLALNYQKIENYISKHLYEYCKWYFEIMPKHQTNDNDYSW